MTSIRNEFLCIEKYLQIINLRFSGCFQFQLHMDEGTSECLMPRFLLQPLVENAISHGLEPQLPKKGILTLAASLRDDSILHFECADDGAGIPPQKLDELRLELADISASMTPHTREKGASGIGLPNIHMRIRLIYGAPFGLSVSSSSQGTVICADFPVDVPVREPV